MKFVRAKADVHVPNYGSHGYQPWVNVNAIVLVDASNKRVLVAGGAWLEFYDGGKFAAFLAAAGLPLTDVKGDTYTAAPTMLEIKTTVEAASMTVDPVW